MKYDHFAHSAMIEKHSLETGTRRAAHWARLLNGRDQKLFGEMIFHIPEILEVFWNWETMENQDTGDPVFLAVNP